MAFYLKKDANQAMYHAKVLERCTKMAYNTEVISGAKARFLKDLLNKHYHRKHEKMCIIDKK